jgi:hypothetical protein
MTIAAGFVHQKGVLLATDSMMSAAEIAFYEKKIVPIPGRDYSALFAFCGDPKFCFGAIRQCEDRLNAHSGADRSRHDIIETIRKVWATEYKRGLPTSRAMGCAIIAAVWTRSAGMTELYGSIDINFGEVPRGFQCIGAGEVPGTYVVGDDGFGPLTPQPIAVRTAISVVERSKWFNPSSCGGDTVLINLGACPRIANLEGCTGTLRVARISGGTGAAGAESTHFAQRTFSKANLTQNDAPSFVVAAMCAY